MVHYIYIEGLQSHNFQLKLNFSEYLFIFANSVDPDEMQHTAAFHLGLHCLPKYPWVSRCFTRGVTYRQINVDIYMVSPGSL